MVGPVGQNGMDYDCIPGQQQNEAEQDFINLYNHGSSRFIDKKMPECTGIFIGTVWTKLKRDLFFIYAVLVKNFIICLLNNNHEF